MSSPRTAAPLFVAPAVWPWPLPALCGWLLGLAAYGAARAVDAPPGLAMPAGVLATLPLAWVQPGRWRGLIVLAGFPLAALGGGLAAAMPAWAWLLALLPLVALYPLRAWADAPFFPTPRDALAGLDAAIGQAPARVLDAGCGLGHGLGALRRVWPQARLDGVEWSRPLALASALRCRFAHVRRGDMWAMSWAPYEVVYLFQRPESMTRAWAKANAEMRPGRWLVSLEFEVPGVTAAACLRGPGRRSVWVYRLGAVASRARARQASITERAGR